MSTSATLLRLLYVAVDKILTVMKIKTQKPTSPTPFHLLRLPYVAVDEILKTMDLESLYNLSKTSTKAREAVKMFTKRRPNLYTFSLHSFDSQLACRIRTVSVNVSQNDETTITGDRVVNQINDLSKVFNISKVDFSFWDLPPHLQSIIHHVKGAGLQIREVFTYGDWDNASYKLMLRECTMAEKLVILAETSFEGLAFSRPPAFNVRDLSISFSPWVDLETLCSCFWACRSISFCSNIIPFSSLDRFFEGWLAHKTTRLECLMILSIWEQDYSIEAILKDIPYTVVQNVRLHDKLRGFSYYSTGYVIRHSNGKEVVVCGDGRRLVMDTEFDINCVKE